MSTRLFVGNVDPAVTSEDLESHFTSIGEVASVTIPIDRETRLPRGFAFVEFRSREQAEKAVESLDGSRLAGRRLRLGWAELDRRRPSRGGGESPARVDDADQEYPRSSTARQPKSREDDDYASRHRDRPAKRGRHGSDRKRGRGTRRVIE